jgi:hypothetical protein
MRGEKIGTYREDELDDQSGEQWQLVELPRKPTGTNKYSICTCLME